MHQYVLGVDGGNTKTVALVASLDGAIVGMGRGGCGDIYNARSVTGELTSKQAALANIELAVYTALAMAGIEPANLVASVFNMAGADWPEDFVFLQAAMDERGFGRKILVQNDAMGVLHAGSTSNIGVSLVCGTAVATGARGPDGRIWHSSYWQDVVQGAEDMGQKALNAVYLAELGIAPATSMAARFIEFYQVSTVEDILYSMTSHNKRPRTQIAQLTPILLDEAQAGDAVAARIVREHGHALGDYVQVAARRVGLEHTPFTLVLAGGVFRHTSTLLSDAIIERAREKSPAMHPTRCRFEPSIGVLLTALNNAGVTIDEALLEQRLVPTIPEQTFFNTIIERAVL